MSKLRISKTTRTQLSTTLPIEPAVATPLWVMLYLGYQGTTYMYSDYATNLSLLANWLAPIELPVKLLGLPKKRYRKLPAAFYSADIDKLSYTLLEQPNIKAQLEITSPDFEVSIIERLRTLITTVLLLDVVYKLHHSEDINELN